MLYTTSPAVSCSIITTTPRKAWKPKVPQVVRRQRSTFTGTEDSIKGLLRQTTPLVSAAAKALIAQLTGKPAQASACKAVTAEPVDGQFDIFQTSILGGSRERPYDYRDTLCPEVSQQRLQPLYAPHPYLLAKCHPYQQQS